MQIKHWRGFPLSGLHLREVRLATLLQMLAVQFDATTGGGETLLFIFAITCCEGEGDAFGRVAQLFGG